MSAKASALPRERVAQRRDRAAAAAMHERLDGGDVHRRREHVVRRLAAVDVVVRMHEARLADAAPPSSSRGAVGEHLVHVHVGLRARAGLPDDERELAVVLAGEHLVGGGDDGVGLLRGRACRGRRLTTARAALDPGQRADQLGRHLLGRDVEVLQRALGLRAPEAVGGDLDLAEGVFLDALLGHARSSPRSMHGDARIGAPHAAHSLSAGPTFPVRPRPRARPRADARRAGDHPAHAAGRARSSRRACATR